MSSSSPSIVRLTAGQTQSMVSRSQLFDSLECAVQRAANALIEHQHKDGYWCFELEADCTIPAEYILMMHYMDELDDILQAKIASYLRARQSQDGGWPLYYGGRDEVSCSVKVYFALKLAGDAPDAPHMLRARERILRMGGAARSNVFTRITLAMFGQIPWRATPFLPAECVLLPRWFPFQLSKVSYWSRTVMVPLLILCTLKARARNPHRISVRELFVTDPEKEKKYFPVRSLLNRALLFLDRAGIMIEAYIPRRFRNRALRKAEAWMLERLGEGGLGAIFPAMVNAYEALDLLGYPPSHPLRLQARRALEDLLSVNETEAYCQPCVSPVWDTVWAALALQQVNGPRSRSSELSLHWLAQRQLCDQPQDWKFSRTQTRGGGWPFQFANPYYPDLDDTAAVAYAMCKTGNPSFNGIVQHAVEWICGMQSKNGGFASFDADNDRAYLNEIPFADHGALLDPATEDVSARCAMFLAQLRGPMAHDDTLEKCLDYLLSAQQPDGAWYGRWGTNFIYGTWSALIALEECGFSREHSAVRRAAAWLKSVQRSDGGWGESCDTYFAPEQRGRANRSTAFQTAWAVLGLLSAGDTRSSAVQRGVAYLLTAQQPDGFWHDPEFTAPGFPRVFYLKYHGYDKYFPLLALARYRNLASSAT